MAEAERTQRERNKKQQNAGENQRDSDTPKAPEQEAGTHPAVLTIYVTRVEPLFARAGFTPKSSRMEFCDEVN
jgi:hypothetical protein